MSMARPAAQLETEQAEGEGEKRGRVEGGHQLRRCRLDFCAPDGCPCCTAQLSGYSPVGLLAAAGTPSAGPRQRHSLMQQSSPAEASSVVSAGCQRTQLMSRGCACSRLHRRLNELPVLPPPLLLSLLPPQFGRRKRSRRLGSAAAASAASAAASSAAMGPATSPSPNIRMALSALPLAISPLPLLLLGLPRDQSTEKIVRSW